MKRIDVLQVRLEEFDVATVREADILALARHLPVPVGSTEEVEEATAKVCRVSHVHHLVHLIGDRRWDEIAKA